MHKLSHKLGNEWVEYSFPPIFSVSVLKATSRIVAGVPHGDAEVFERLVSSLEAPYSLLYVLHTPRGEGEPGRYQSPELSSETFHAFIGQFKSYLSADARFDLWAHSRSENATVVWDRHNLLYAYGPLDKFSSELRTLGFSNGVPQVPDPHQHHYREALDSSATDLLAAFQWSRSLLKPADEQFPIPKK
jgi:hypothetical protein